MEAGFQALGLGSITRKDITQVQHSSKGEKIYKLQGPGLKQTN